MSSIGGPELLIVLIILLLVFGGSQLPKLARSLGEARREFEKNSSSDDKALDADTRTPEEKKADELALKEKELQRREDEVRRQEETRRTD